MKTVIGILVLVICAIGAISVLRWVFAQVSKLLSHKSQKAASTKKKFIRIGHPNKLACYDELPEANKYKGRTWLGGLPTLADVVVPDKHSYSTIIYMDHWLKQYVYDVMSNWKSTYDGFAKEGVGKSWFFALFFPVMFVIGGTPVGLVLLITGLFYAYILFGTGPVRATRRMGENAKNFTPATWRQIYQEVAESKAREDELVRALRRSGIRRI